MTTLVDMLWIEGRKAWRSRLPLWTALGSLAMPLGIAFLIFVARNPRVSSQLGLVGAKANLTAYAATDWPTYLGTFGGAVGAGGLILFILILAWIFGREFADGTVKDLLAVPVPRASLLLAKFIVAALWSEVITGLIFIAGLLTGALMQLPGGSPGVLLQGAAMVWVVSGLVLAATWPFALLASVGRGLFLPIGVAILMIMMINLALILGWGEYFPWAVPILFAMGKTVLGPASYASVALTGLAGLLGTYWWWQQADQSR